MALVRSLSAFRLRGRTLSSDLLNIIMLNITLFLFLNTFILNIIMFRPLDRILLYIINLHHIFCNTPVARGPREATYLDVL